MSSRGPGSGDARGPSSGGERHYVVFNCQACGAKIFADAHQIGRAGICPACRQLTGVAPQDPKARVSGPAPRPGNAGPSGRTRANERRRARRIAVPDSRVGLEGRGGQPQPLGAGELAELVDLSEGGFGFLAPGEKDRKKLTGFAPPAIRLGETLTITLHVPALFRPRTLRAVVRRIQPHATRKDLFRIGAEFVALPEDARADIRRLVERRPETRG